MTISNEYTTDYWAALASYIRVIPPYCISTCRFSVAGRDEQLNTCTDKVGARGTAECLSKTIWQLTCLGGTEPQRHSLDR
jgi:hypothetical protein